MKAKITGSYFAVIRGHTTVAMFCFHGLALEFIASARHRAKDRIVSVAVIDSEDLPPHVATKALRRASNLCVRCGKPAQLYSGRDNYSAQCQSCNETQCVKRNAASARRRASQ